ncbi:hypothetical protein C2857_000843 [Epichloe festucae Fl1]|uniref:CCCH zinc finger and RRM domain-containing protein n=1 Tax=Epichloe festucae (strain Fl1) TaxID=877507 RepID=A0A7U3Q194_EPIFF|nr:hypothetical protein C2857_000843 [Epichloe festucae Fl1]
MLFSEEDAPLLKAWIVKRIENTSDADADVLAEYVIALLKHDGNKESVRTLCEQEIPDFLTEDPKQFLDDVFRAITYRSYMPGAPPPPLKKVPAGPAAASASPGPSRKRRIDETGGQDEGHEKHGAHGRALKQARRGRRGGRTEDRQGHGNIQSQFHGQQYPMGMMMPLFDPNNPMEAMMRMQAMGMPFPGMGDTSGWFGAGRSGTGGGQRRKRCRDFDMKGYCSRGSTCVYDHGGGEVPNQDEYDPSNAMVLPFPPPDINMDIGRGRGRKGRQRGGRKGGARASFSAEGPVNDQSKTAIVVENIPEDHFGEDHVRGFFSQFGDIVDVSMQPYKRLAIVKFDNWSSANDAYRSPKVIFDNRFVKVFWYKDEKEKEKMLPSVLNGSGSKPGLGSDEMDTVPPIDVEEFQRKQEEAQKLYQERQDKRTELQKQREQLEKQQQELLTKHQAETERLRAKLAEKDSGAEASPGSSSGADMLRAKLAALEQEAKILGIDPDAVDQAGEYYPPRGGYWGRGGFRGGYRARGLAPRGRGSLRGQAGRHAAYAQFSIDNRPKKLAFTGVDFTPSEKDEQLRHFLLNMGEFESVATSPAVTHVSFRDRKTAEKVYFSLHGKELPGVQGKLDLSWVNSPLPHVNTKALTQEENGAAGGDAMAGMDDEREGTDADAEESRAVNMDYEAGDDYGWEG